MQSTVLSIIIPVYNAEKYIEQCINSIKMCNSAEIEVLLIDDGSHDRSKQIALECIGKDTRFQLISQENGGVSKARNAGIHIAQGEYITFLDADDYYKEHALDIILKDIAEISADYIAYAYTTLFADGAVKKEKFAIQGMKTSDHLVCDYIMYASSRFNMCWGKIFRRKKILDYRIIFPEGVAIGEDLVFVQDYYKYAQTVMVSNQEIIMYRQNAESAMHRYSIQDRIRYTRPLFEYSMQVVGEKNEKRFSQAVFVYYFRVMTNLCREFATGREGRRNIRQIYKDPIVKRIMQELRISMIPGYKIPEYLLMRTESVGLSALYFCIKEKVSRK